VALEERAHAFMSELSGYLQIIAKRLWLIALLVVVTVSGIYYVESTRPPKYQAMVRLQVLAVESEDVTLFTPLRQAVSDELIRRTEEEFINVLRNREVAWEAARVINAESQTSLTADDIIDVMWPILEGDFLRITYVSADTATLAQRIANVHVEKALEYYRSSRTRGVHEIRLFIEKQLAQQQEKLLAAQGRLRKFQLKYNLTDIDREAASLQEQVRALQLQRDQVQRDMERAQAMAQTYEERAQAVRARAKALADTDEDLAKAYQAQALSYDSRAVDQRALAAGQKAALRNFDRLIADYKADLSNLIALETTYDNLQYEVKQERDRVTFLSDKLNEAKIKEEQALSGGYLQVVEEAREPVQPAPRQTWRLVLFGAALATIVGIVLAFLLEFLGGLFGQRQRTA